MKKYILIFIFALIHGFTAGLQAQETVVSGKVSDKDGQELVGVAVIETGTNHATVSATDGSYKLTVSGKNARLEFRMLGYIPQEITVGSRTVIDITLEEEALNINEVVVVGYGTQNRRRVHFDGGRLGHPEDGNDEPHAGHRRPRLGCLHPQPGRASGRGQRQCLHPRYGQLQQRSQQPARTGRRRGT